MAKYVLAITKDAEKLFRRSEEVLVVGYNSKIRPEVSGVIKDLKTNTLTQILWLLRTPTWAL